MKETSSTIVKWYSMRQVAAELGMAVNTFKTLFGKIPT